jgi:hypothetical protein
MCPLPASATRIGKSLIAFFGSLSMKAFVSTAVTSVAGSADFPASFGACA